MSKFLNLNTLQTVLTGFILFAMGALKFTGCVELPDGTPDCAQSWLGQYISQATLLWIVGIVSFVKLTVIPWFQPGGLIRNLFQVKIPISTSGAPGTVTPEQVKK